MAKVDKITCDGCGCQFTLNVHIVHIKERAFLCQKCGGVKTSADHFRICFNDVGIHEAVDIFHDEIDEATIGSWQFVVDFNDGSTFRYYV